MSNDPESSKDETFVPGPEQQGLSPRDASEFGDYENNRRLESTFISGLIPNAKLSDRYVLVEKIGEGGMGEVWIARQTEPVKRSVALKLIKAGMDSKAVLLRFEQERQALAMMDHPNIAKVYDAGVTPTGHPFFAMELVNGQSLTKYCDNNRLSPRQRLELFVPICQAVQHAHQKGIVHRDLKPANILVTAVDGKATPKVIDFGVAKATGGKLTEDTLATGFGAAVGTLEYMSPEQAGTTGVDVDTRADIYSLGVVLYELLTGLRPFDSVRLRKAALSEMFRIIREEDPSRPSTRLSTDDALPSLAALRQTEPRKLMAELRGELDWVVMKCLEKSRERRYETANGLARDIQRYLSDEPVEAKPPSAAYRLRKLFDRNRAAVLTSGLVVLLLIAGVVGTTLGWLEARKQTDIASKKATEADVARLRESEQRRAAEQSNEQAFVALESFTSNLMGKLLGGRTELTQTEISVLENAQKQWEVFAESKGTSPEARRIRAEGAANLAIIQEKLGLNVQAEANDRKALALRESLAAEFPKDARFRKAWAISLHNLGGSLRAVGQREEAGQRFRKAAEVFASLVQEHPENDSYQSWQADSLLSAANVERDFGTWKEANAMYLQALSLQEKLVAGSPENLEYLEAVARCHWGLAFLNKRQDQHPEAAGHYQKSIAVYGQMLEKAPAEVSYRQAIGNLQREFGVLLSDGGDDAAGAEQLEKALPVLKSLASEFPAIPDHRSELAKALRDYGQILGFLKRTDEAVQQMNAALELQTKLVNEHATILPYQADLGLTHRMLGVIFLETKQADRALSQAETAVKVLSAAFAQDRNYLLVKRSLCKSHALRAATLHEQKRYAEAVTDWDRALELKTEDMSEDYRSARIDSRIRSGAVAESINELSELTKIETSNATHWFNFARLYAIAGTRIPDRSEEFSNQTILLLQRAVSLGFNDAERLTSDEDLQPLREQNAFKAILKLIEQSKL